MNMLKVIVEAVAKAFKLVQATIENKSAVEIQKTVAPMQIGFHITENSRDWNPAAIMGIATSNMSGLLPTNATLGVHGKGKINVADILEEILKRTQSYTIGALKMTGEEIIRRARDFQNAFGELEVESVCSGRHRAMAYMLNVMFGGAGILYPVKVYRTAEEAMLYDFLDNTANDYVTQIGRLDKLRAVRRFIASGVVTRESDIQNKLNATRHHAQSIWAQVEIMNLYGLTDEQAVACGSYKDITEKLKTCAEKGITGTVEVAAELTKARAETVKMVDRAKIEASAVLLAGLPAPMLDLSTVKLSDKAKETVDGLCEHYAQLTVATTLQAILKAIATGKESDLTAIVGRVKRSCETV
jgi:hypothetical protein